jgi:hypothetical protein
MGGKAEALAVCPPEHMDIIINSGAELVGLPLILTTSYYALNYIPSETLPCT